METPCVAILISNSKNVIFFFYLLSSTKLKNRRAEQVLPVRVRGSDNIGRGERMGKGGQWLNMVQTMYTHVRKCKNDTC
jgi:hypothetical protein